MRGGCAAVAGVFLVVLCHPGLGVAAPTVNDQATAEALFRHGKELLAQRAFAAACTAFEESQRLDPGVGTLLNLGDCYEKSGKVTSAWTTFGNAAAAARGVGQPDREQIARVRALALEPRLPRLVITVSPDAAASFREIRRDGVLIAQSVWGVSVPVDPGDHDVEASRNDGVVWRTRIVAREGTTATVVVPVAGPDQLEEASPYAHPNTVQAPEGETRSTWTTRKTISVAVAAAGVVTMGVGGLVGLGAKSKYDDASRYCGPEGCREPGYTARGDAIGQANVATALVALGAVVTGVGGVLFFTAPSEADRVGLTPVVGVHVAGATLNGAF